MKMQLAPERAHQEIFDDEDFQFVVEQAGRDKAMLHFVGLAIARYEGLEEVRRGKAGGVQNMEALANSFHRDQRSRAAAVALARRFERLYQHFDAGNVRGCLIEAMVETRLRARYADAESQLENNVFVSLSNGATYRTSTSVDVVGHDGRRGECHDCKARGRNVKTEWIAELVTQLVQYEFRIGVATAESAPTALRAMTANGFSFPQSVSVTGPESWWEGLPLWAT